MHFGVPRELHSDQGRFQEMRQSLGIKKTRTTALHPQSDGMVERYNRTLATQMSLFVDNHQKGLDQHVPLLLMAYRSAVHDTTRCTPAKLMLGRDLRLPVDLIYGCPEEKQPATSYVETLQERMEHVHTFARQHMKLASDRMKRYYNIDTQESKLEVGDPVWLYNPQRRKG